MMSTHVAATPEALTLADLEGVPGVLGKISRERFEDYMTCSLGSLESVEPRPSFKESLKRAGLSIIAEIKRSSPSQGSIADLDPVEAAQSYRRGGAAALSVLTEERHFGGRLEYLQSVARAVNLPLLRKDFTVHPQQILEAKNLGASAVLLIVAVLGERTKTYLDYAHALGLDALVEVHDEAELDIALASGADIIGVNNRNLQTLEIDTRNAPRLIGRAKKQGYSGVLVAESGYKEASELLELVNLADAVLIGTSLAGSGNLEAGVKALKNVL